MTLAFFLSHWFHFFYVPAGEPWYHGNVWGNAMVILVLAPLGWLWSKTKFWPLRPIKHGIQGLHEKLDAHHKRVEAHNEWMAKTHAAIHREITGKEPPPHPHFDI